MTSRRLLLSRRGLLAGAAGSLVLVACGNGDDGGSSATTLELDEVGSDSLVLAAAFNPGPGYAAAGVEQRLTWSLRSADGAPAADPPSSLAMSVYYEGTPDDAGPDGEGLHRPIGDPIDVPLHDVDIPIPYYPLQFTPAEPGFYSAVVTIDGDEIGGSFEVSPADEVDVVEVGQAMVPVDTPTTADARGVDPICTLDPPCPFHEVTVAEAMGNGQPVALLISTPAFCQTDICGPVLDLLVAAAPDHPGVTFIHAEVYNEPEADPADPAAEGVTAAVTDFGLNFEPTLYLADATGTVVGRLDNIYDAVELRDALGGVGSA